MKDRGNNNVYDEEPVLYCTKCYSLSIMHEDSIDEDCCSECGCSDIAETSIEEWERLYARRYGHKYLEKNEDPYKSYLYKLSFSELKTLVYKEKFWARIVRNIYPRFPGGLSREDSLILFFDYLIRDNRIDDLRNYLYKHNKR